MDATCQLLQISCDSMRLGIFSTTFFAYETVMGVSNTAYLISRVLTEDYDTEVFVFAPLEKRENQKIKEDILRLHIRRFDTIGPKMLGIFNTGSIGNKLDVIHSYHYGYFPASAGFRYAKIKKLPHFFTTAYHPHQLNIFRKGLFRLYNKIEGKKLLQGSNVVLPFNNNEMNQLKGISNGNYVTVPSPINTDLFFPRRRKNKKLTLGYVGNLLPWKGAGIAMDICKQIEADGYDASFAFIGQGPMEEELKKKASDNFTFAKNLSIEKLAEWYNNIDILLYPSFYESFGRILAEAVTCGCAVVSTKVGAIPETTGIGGILVDYGDWKSMKESAIKLIENKSLRNSLSKKGIKHAKNYGYRQVAKKVFEFYSEFTL